MLEENKKYIELQNALREHEMKLNPNGTDNVKKDWQLRLKLYTEGMENNCIGQADTTEKFVQCKLDSHIKKLKQLK